MHKSWLLTTNHHHMSIHIILVYNFLNLCDDVVVSPIVLIQRDSYKVMGISSAVSTKEL